MPDLRHDSEIILTLAPAPDPDGVPVPVRVRRALKYLLRVCRLKRGGYRPRRSAE